ncbi:caldesmon-like isoform X3 [Mya arenaria]|uniref:caldesmon-like isoform X3 n=1 Tax=Mya arenaria TaxID=6604 RepID=UPI0022E11647|nr:caldesmon-like isoform X3 [Mya arenaria]
MSRYLSPPAGPTFCEVTYDSDWFEDDRRLTPYRYSLLRNDTDSNSDSVSLTLPSHTYYEYLKSLYDCRTTPSRAHTSHHCPPGSEQGRAPTWHAFNKDAGSEVSRHGVKSEPTRPRPAYPFPSLHLIQGGDSGDELEEESSVADRGREKLVWVDALNKWVPEKQLHARPYMSFIGNAPVIDKQSVWRSHREQLGGERDDSCNTGRGVPCERFEYHMGGGSFSHRATTAPGDTTRNNEKREAIRRRAQEIAEQRRQQRKAYSTPLYTSPHERKQAHKARVQSSRLPQSTPVSPTNQQHKERPPPKQVWQADDVSRLKARPSPPPIKREISITLMSPKPEELDSDNVDDGKDKVSEKKVSFTDMASLTKAPSPLPNVKKKKDSETDLQRQQLQQQQREAEERELAKLEAQKREEERKAREKLAEEERARKLRESNNLHKQPLSQRAQNHENYYENTMNAAAGHLFSHTPIPNDSENVSQSKPPHKLEKLQNKIPDNKDISKVKVGKKATYSKSVKLKENDASTEKINIVENIDTTANNEDKAKNRNVKKNKQANVKSKDNVKGRSKSTKDDTDGHVINVKISDSLGLDDGGSDGGVDRNAKRRKGKAGKQTGGKTVKPEVTKKKNEHEKSEEKLPIVQTLPDVTKEKKVEEPVVQPHSIKEKREIVKKERRERPCTKHVEEEKKEALPPPPDDAQKKQSWIFETEDFTEEKEEKEESMPLVPLASLADLNPELIAKEKKENSEKKRKKVLAKLISTDHAVKKWRKPGNRDSSYTDELRRLELAEERRKKQQEMFERLKARKLITMNGDQDDGSPKFEDYGFLAKYCIFTKGNIEMYRHAFEAVDDTGIGWLEGEDVMIALRGVNNKLTEAEEEYLYRVLELTGYQITHGADFKTFSVLAALSHRISMLDHWMKNLIGQMDFKALEMKMFKCRSLWECNVDKETNSIPIDQLCVDLRAGGVSLEHELEVREKLSHLHALDLLDFLTYVPLFITIHEAVVRNPLDDSRTI